MKEHKKNFKFRLVALLLTIAVCIMPLSAFAGEQLGQNTFDDGVGIPWHICESGPADLDFNIDNGTYNITILNPGGAARGGESRWDCQLRHRGLTVKADHNYTVKFEVTPTNSGYLYTKIGDLSGNIEVWHNACNDSNFDSTWDAIYITAGQKYTCNVSFTAKQTEEVAEWAYHIGGAGNYQPQDCFPVGTTLSFDNLYFIDNTNSENDYIAEDKYVRNSILVNQLGYYPKLSKQATLVVDEGDMTAKGFELLDSKGDTVYTGNSKPVGYDKDSGDWVHILDFTDYIIEGTGYTLKCGSKTSYSFDISNNIYDGVLKDSLNYYYQNRSGVAIKSDYITSGDKKELAHQAGHNPDMAYVQSEWIKSYDSEGNNVDKSKRIDVSGGWYDAGDHGKYVVNGGISVWTLNNIYERSLVSGDTSKWKDNSGTVLIPENGNQNPDILDETRVEMEWMLKMVVNGGEYNNMVYHKIHDHKWTGLAVEPWNYASSWKTVRIVKPPTTAATLNVVACAAQSYRLWKEYDEAFANRCLEQAKKSYQAAVENPEMYAPLDQAIGGGAYGDNNVKDDFYWAACELYASTGDKTYYNDLMKYSEALAISTHVSGGENNGSCTSFNWGNTAGLGTLTLYLNHKSSLSDEDFNTVKESITKAADYYIQIEKSQGYGIPYVGTTFTDPINIGDEEVTGYEWGSNSMVVNNAIVMAYAYDITNNSDYADGVSTAMDYIYGRNAVEYSYVTGYGEHSTKYPHHRYWANQLDSKFPLAPSGVLSGGANSGMQDPYIQGAGYKRGNVAPQLCYIDNIESWSTNEVTINWNAPFAWVTSWLEDEAPMTPKNNNSNNSNNSSNSGNNNNSNNSSNSNNSDIAKYILGDVNNDKVVDILDVVLIRGQIVGNITLNTNQRLRADVNIDEEIDISDVVLIRSAIVNDTKL